MALGTIQYLLSAGSGGPVGGGALTEAQLKSVIYVGEAHVAHLDRRWTIDAT